MKRHDGRAHNELRSLKIRYNIFPYTPGSVLIELGNTKVLCAVTLQSSIPPFLRGQGTGWLTAEYALLPASTTVRTQRESSAMRRHHRSVEISRLLSRALRSIVDLSALGERSIMIDCDVLQADGGTRTAALTGAFAALSMAQKHWKEKKIIVEDILTHSLAAVSVGVLSDNSLVLDPDFQEDSAGIADINFIMTHTGQVIEVQGGAEKEPIAWEQFIQAGLLAKKGIESIASFFKTEAHNKKTSSKKNAARAPFFSLQARKKDEASL